jgi:hypothetical protein
VNVFAVSHSIAFLLALDVVSKKPQLARADEVIGNFGAGDGS